MTVHRVKSNRGERVSVTVRPRDIWVADDSNLWDELRQHGITLLSFLALIAGIGLSIMNFVNADPLRGTACLVAGLVLGYPALKEIADSALGIVVLPIMVVYILVMLPFRSGRARMKRWFTSSSDSGQDRRSTDYRTVAAVTIRDGWGGIRVTVERPGRETLKLRARGDRGRRLGALLSRLPVPYR